MAREGQEGGYNLLDLLITVAIISTLATLSTSFTPIIQHERSVQAVMDLRNLLNFARGQAVTLQQYVTLCALDTDGRCERDWEDRDYAVFIDHDGNHQLDEDDEVLRRGFWSARRGSLRWRASLARSYIIFKKWGQTAQNGSFYFCPPDRGAINATAIIVNRAGRNYVATDRNLDGIRESASGKALSCN